MKVTPWITINEQRTIVRCREEQTNPLGILTLGFRNGRNMQKSDVSESNGPTCARHSAHIGAVRR